MSDQTLLLSSNEPFCEVGAEFAPFVTSFIRISLVEVIGLATYIQPLAYPQKDFYITISPGSAFILLFYVSMNGIDKTLKANLGWSSRQECSRYVFRTEFPQREDCEVIGNWSKTLEWASWGNFIYVKLSIACREHIHAFEKKYQPLGTCWHCVVHALVFNEVFGAHANFDL